MTIPNPSQNKIKVWNQRIEINFHVRGTGPELIYFHPAAGFSWDPFLEKLSEFYTVYAPEFPGTTPGNPYDIHQVDDLGDALLMYEEALRALGLQGAMAVGHSFGGMLALELAAAFPNMFSKLVVISPIGLWREEAPVTNWIAASPEELPAILFKDPLRPSAQAMLAMPTDPAAAVLATAQFIWNIGATGKMVWPIPDRGLQKRLHRVATPTFIVWGEDDALISSSYAHWLGELIAGSRVAIVKDCGHIPQVEQQHVTLALVDKFLGTKRLAA